MVGVYFDKMTNEARERSGHKRYAAHLVRFATEVRMLQDFGLDEVVRFKSKRYVSVIKIAIRRELKCCENIDCEMKHIYQIQRWLRNN